MCDKSLVLAVLASVTGDTREVRMRRGCRNGLLQPLAEHNRYTWRAYDTRFQGNR